MEIVFKLATINQVEELASLKLMMWQQNYANIYPVDKLSNYDHKINQNKFTSLIKKTNLYCVYDENKMIGYFAYGNIIRPYQNYQYEIHLLYILSDYKRNKIGESIFSFVKKQLKKNQVKKFIVYCNKYNNNAISFYKKMGGLVIKIDDDNLDESIPQVIFEFQA